MVSCPSTSRPLNIFQQVLIEFEILLCPTRFRFNFLRQSSHWLWNLKFRLDWLIRNPLGPACLYTRPPGLKWQTSTTVSAFVWVLQIWTQDLISRQQVLYHLPSPPPETFKRCMFYSQCITPYIHIPFWSIDQIPWEEDEICCMSEWLIWQKRNKTLTYLWRLCQSWVASFSMSVYMKKISPYFIKQASLAEFL